MKLIMLGTGSCVPCASRASAGLWIEGGDFGMIMDCGAGTLHAMPRHRVPWSRTTHVLVSHFHLDHVGELPSLLFALKHSPGAGPSRSAPLTLIGPAGLGNILRGWEDSIGYAFSDTGFPVGTLEIADGRAISVADGCSLSAAKAVHTDEALAYRVDERGTSFGYTGDTGPAPWLAGFFRGVDLLVADCSFMAPGGEGAMHMSVAEVASLARQAGARRLVATHVYPDMDAGEMERDLRASFGATARVAYDGMTVEF